MVRKKRAAKRRSAAKDSPRRPSAKDFSAGAVERAVWAEALQHPLTLFPGAGAILGALYMGLINLSQTSFAFTLASGLLGLGSLVFNYFVRGESLARKHIERLKQRRLAYREEEADEVLNQCRDMGFEDGARAVGELKEAYLKLRELLSKRLENGGSGVQRFLVMAEDCYHEGLSLLSTATASFQVLNGVDPHKLASDKRAWEAQATAIETSIDQGDSRRAGELEAVRARIESFERRLDLYRKRFSDHERLMAQCELLESALETAYMEVLDLLGDEHLFRKADPANKLERAVAAARSVEDRLRGLNDHSQEDAFYREAGQKALTEK